MGVGHGHSHAHGSDARVPVARARAWVLIGLLVVIGGATAAGAVRWWPDHDKASALHGTLKFAAPGSAYIEAIVDVVQPRCPAEGQATLTCGNVIATPLSGPDDGTPQTVGVPPAVADAKLRPGDKVTLIRTPEGDGAPVSYAWYDVPRQTPLWILAGVFVLAVVAVARLRGLLAMVSLALAGGVIGWFIVPGMLTGGPPLAVAVVGASVILYAVLFLTHGFSVRTSTALAGTLIGLAISAAAATWAIDASHLNGVIDDGAATLSSLLPHLNLHDVLKAAAVIAGLGALNDVTITQASSVWELRAAAPEMSRSELYRSAMRIGRDHVASAIYTLAFAYVGTALTLLLALGLYDRSLWSLLGAEEIAEEIVRSLAGGLGLIAAMPATTLIGVLVVAGTPPKVEDHDPFEPTETRASASGSSGAETHTPSVGRHAAPYPD